MSVCYTSDLEYAHQKLQDSLVSYKRLPVFVRHVGNNGIATYETLSGRHYECPLSDLDLTPIKLGYVNQENSCGYVMRVPARHWRQGLREGITHTIGGNVRRLFNSGSGLINTVLGIYPTPTECIEAIANDEATARAFSRSFAIIKPRRKGSYDLSFKGRVVGVVTMGEARAVFSLAPDFQYLSEMLEEEIGDRV